jgi:hypothetical protein
MAEQNLSTRTAFWIPELIHRELQWVVCGLSSGATADDQ